MADYSIIENNIETIKKMATQGDADAQNKLGICYKLGLAGFPIDYEESARWFMKSAEQGWEKAQCNLAFCYKDGKGVLQSDVDAFKWFEKAAEQGLATAQFQLAWCYSDGKGVNQDLEKAFEWFSKAANQGHPWAQFKLGYCFELGEGVIKDLVKAVEWYETSALQGNHMAQTNLAYCYEAGNGTTQDYVKAAEWYAKAAEQGNERALNNMGFLYEKGYGVEKNYKKAFELYSKSAEQGNIVAVCNVGYCCENGIGTPKSYIKAASFYTKASENGNEYAKNALKRIEEKVREEEFYKSIKFTTRQKVGNMTYARVIPLGKNYIVKRKGLWGIVNKHNTELLPMEYTRVHWFDGGYAGIEKNKKWGLVNCEGTITIEPQYESLHYLSQHNACDVESGNDRFLVDTNNHVIMRVKGKTVRFSGDKLIVCSKGEWQLFNMDGTPFSKVHRIIANYYSNYWIGYDGDDEREETLIKENGDEVKFPSFEIGVFKEKITQFRKNNKYGIIDDNANIIVPNQYDYITLGEGIIAINEGNETKDHDRNFLARPRDGKWLFWNYAFKEITPYKYDNIEHEYSIDGEVWFGKRDGVWYQIEPEGEELYAYSESEFNKKKANIEKKRKKEPGWGKFGILEDARFHGEGRKLFVRSCDGYYIRHYYFTPYLPSDSDMKWHRQIGEYFVNKYGQEMFDPHAFKMPKQKKPRHLFKLNQKILTLNEKELIEGFVAFTKDFGIKEDDAIALYAIYETRRKRAILLDWLIRKYKRNKNFKLDFDDLASLSVDIENWDKKRR